VRLQGRLAGAGRARVRRRHIPRTPRGALTREDEHAEGAEEAGEEGVEGEAAQGAVCQLDGRRDEGGEQDGVAQALARGRRRGVFARHFGEDGEQGRGRRRGAARAPADRRHGGRHARTQACRQGGVQAAGASGKPSILVKRRHDEYM
jgi:hypothetical protein